MTTLVRTAGRVVVVAVLATAGTAVAVATAAPAQAATCDLAWVGPAGGDWAAATNWSPAQTPTSSTHVCVTTAGGPTVASGTTAQAAELNANGSAIRIDGLLQVGGADLTATDLSGAGQLGRLAGHGNVDANLTGVRLGGKLAMTGFAFLDIEGSRTQCGQQLALCLTGSSRVQAQEVFVGGTIAGGTTARPGLSIASLYFLGTQPRIKLDVAATQIYSSISNPTAELDQWDQLAADGTLTANINWSYGTLVLARPIVNLDAGYSAVPGSVRTIAGADALSELTSVGPAPVGIGLPLPSVVTPQGGRLTIEPNATATTYSQSSTSTIDGALQVDGSFGIDLPIHADSLVSTGTTSLNAALTANTAVIDGGRVDIPVHTTLTVPGGVTVENGGTLSGEAKSTCATIDGALTMTGPNFLSPSLVNPRVNCAALFSVAGPVSLPATLKITSSRRSPSVGTQVVVINAPAGLSGTFSKITGASTGANHWAVSYTATQLIATVVAGPA